MMNEPLKRRFKERRLKHEFREAKQTDFEDSANGLAGEAGGRDEARRNAVRQASQGGRTFLSVGLNVRQLHGYQQAGGEYPVLPDGSGRVRSV